MRGSGGVLTILKTEMAEENIQTPDQDSLSYKAG